MYILTEIITKFKSIKNIINQPLEELKRVIDIKCSQWLKNKEFNKNLRPSTLFRPSNYENYRNELQKKDIGRLGNGKSKGKYADCIDEEV